MHLLGPHASLFVGARSLFGGKKTREKDPFSLALPPFASLHLAIVTTNA